MVRWKAIVPGSRAMTAPEKKSAAIISSCCIKSNKTSPGPAGAISLPNGSKFILKREKAGQTPCLLLTQVPITIFQPRRGYTLFATLRHKQLLKAHCLPTFHVKHENIIFSIRASLYTFKARPREVILKGVHILLTFLIIAQRLQIYKRLQQFFLIFLK